MIAGFLLTFIAVFLALQPDANMLSQSPDILPSATLAETANSPCEGPYDRPIVYKRLSEESTTPFILASQPLQPDRHDYDKYIASIDRFPNVQSCLIDSEKEKHSPDLTLFDWDKITGTYDAEVCLFRVFSSIGTVEASKQWLASQGFDGDITTTISEVVMSNMLDKDDALPGTGIGASWSTKECGARFGSNIVDKRSQELYTYGFSVSVTFSGNGDVVWVDVTHTIL